VVGDVSAGAKVVTSGQTQLADGTAVLVRGEETPSRSPGSSAAAGLAESTAPSAALAGDNSKPAAQTSSGIRK
jgi:hypothetical protein